MVKRIRSKEIESKEQKMNARNKEKIIKKRKMVENSDEESEEEVNSIMVDLKINEPMISPHEKYPTIRVEPDTDLDSLLKSIFLKYSQGLFKRFFIGEDVNVVDHSTLLSVEIERRFRIFLELVKVVERDGNPNNKMCKSVYKLLKKIKY